MRRLFVYFGILLPLLAQDAAIRPARVGVGVVQRKLTLQEAVELALKNNLEIEIEKTNTANAQQFVRSAEGVFDPVLRYLPLVENRNTPTASVLQGAGGLLNDKYFNNNVQGRMRLTKFGTSLGLDFLNSRQVTTNPFTSFTPLLSSQLTLSVTQPLLRNREIDRDRAEIRIRRKQVDTAQTDFTLRVIEIVTRVEQAYWNLVAARQDVGVTNEAVELARQQLSINQRLVDSGTLAPVELAASEAELQRRMDGYLAALGSVTETENALKTLLATGRDELIWGEEIVPAEAQALQPRTDELSELVSQAIRRRPELKRVGTQKEVNDIQKELAANQRKPQLDAVTAYTLSGLGGSVRLGDNPFTASTAAIYQQLNLLSQRAGIAPLDVPAVAPTPGFLIGGYGTTLGNMFGGRYQSFQAGVQLDWNMRNRTADALIAQASIGERRLRLEQARTEQVIEAQVRNALQAIQTAKQRVASADVGSRAAKEKLDSETRLFQAGESTNFLVLTRQNEFADARRRAVVATLDLNKAVSLLEQALGTTLENYKIQLP